MNRPKRLFNGDPDFPDTRFMTPEQRMQYMAGFDAAMPKLSEANKGTIVILGTAGDFNSEVGKLAAIYYSRPIASMDKVKVHVEEIMRYFQSAIQEEEKFDKYGKSQQHE